MADKVFSLRWADVRLLVISSYLLALIADSMIGLSFRVNFFPSITLIVLLFWTVKILNQTHLFTAFALGLLFDALMNAPLGSHGMMFLTITFLMLRSRLRFKGYPVWQQSLIILSYFVLYQIFTWFLFSPNLIGNQWLYFLIEPLIAALVWPLLTALLHQLTHRTVFN